MNFGEKIKMLRKQKGLSQAELGKLVHVSARSITAYETSGAYPRKIWTQMSIICARKTKK